MKKYIQQQLSIANNSTTGFALPTVLVTALVMLAVLVTAGASLSQIRAALDAQHYNQLAREAAESGAARAQACLYHNGFIAQWEEASPLRPNTDCEGGSPCDDDTGCFVVSADGYRTTFTVAEPEGGAASQSVSVTGKTELVRTSSGEPWKTYEQVIKTRTGIGLSANKVAFGYAHTHQGSGAFFFTIDTDSRVRATGFNAFGQLGIGTTNSSLTPSVVNLPDGATAASVYTNFVSQGVTNFILATNGKVYGAGNNLDGQLGDGSHNNNRETMVEFQLPADEDGRHVTISDASTYVVTTENNIYAVGDNQLGQLGAGGSYPATPNPVRVDLPTPDPSDPNTIPTNDIVTDRDSVFVRMEGGAVYGWGTNDQGQLATGNFQEASSPVRVGAYGEPGQPKAVDIAFDGDTIYIVDDSGQLHASGRNHLGQAGGAAIFANQASNNGRCIDNQGNNHSNGNPITIYTCNLSGAQAWIANDLGQLQNAASGKCLDGGSVNEYDTVHLQPCDSTETKSQSWHYNTANKIVNAVDSDICLAPAYEARGAPLINVRCHHDNDLLRWSLLDLPVLVPVQIPDSAGDVVQVATDQWFTAAMTENGEVWSFGVNVDGSAGSGDTALRQMAPQQFDLPPGVQAEDIYVTSINYTDPFNNLFVVGSDGKVYGAGDNYFGQLGDGTTTDRHSPVAMDVIDGNTIVAQDVLSGFGTTVVLATDGRTYTVGRNNSGQLGDGTTNNSSTPSANNYTNIVPLIVF